MYYYSLFLLLSLRYHYLFCNVLARLDKISMCLKAAIHENYNEIVIAGNFQKFEYIVNHIDMLVWYYHGKVFHLNRKIPKLQFYNAQYFFHFQAKPDIIHGPYNKREPSNLLTTTLRLRFSIQRRHILYKDNSMVSYL